MGRTKSCLWKADMVRALFTGKVPFAMAAMAFFYVVAAVQQQSADDVYSIYSDVSTSSFGILAYVLCALPYAAGFCEDTEHKYIYQVLTREKKWKYVLSKTAAVFVSAAAVFCGGNVLFLFLEQMRYPLVNETGAYYMYPLEGEDLVALLHSGRHAAYFGICIFTRSLLGGLLSVFAAYVSLYLKNKMAVFCTPMVVYYFGINFMAKYLGLSGKYNPMHVYDVCSNLMGTGAKSVLYAVGYTIAALAVLFVLCLHKIGRDYS